MTYKKTDLPGVWIVEPSVFQDSRGYFMEAFKQAEFDDVVGKIRFVQDNESKSTRGVLRGLHYQLAPYSQAKLVRVIRGCVLDVAVDLRAASPTFGRYIAVELSEENKRQLFIPQGFAHGFQVLSEEAIFTYKVDKPYMPAYERGIRFDDPTIGVAWRELEGVTPLLSAKDQASPFLQEAEYNF